MVTSAASSAHSVQLIQSHTRALLKELWILRKLFGFDGNLDTYGPLGEVNPAGKGFT